MTDSSFDAESRIAIGTLSLPRQVRAAITQLALQSGSLKIACETTISSRGLLTSDAVVEACHRSRIRAVPLTSERYPAALKTIDSPPLVLFLKTHAPIDAIPDTVIAVVGARSASVETCQRTTIFTRELAAAGVTIASGLAIGVDGAAHRGSLRSGLGLPTIAVLAHGLDTVYPTSHANLASLIVERGGMLVSEYPPGVSAHKHHFLERNRIIAGISRGVVVIEAGERSGSLVTAQCAADYGRDVFVLDNGSRDDVFHGGARLLQDGAIAVRDAEDVLREYGLSTAPRKPAHWITIGDAELAAVTRLTPLDLIELEMAGDLVRIGGGQVMIRDDDHLYAAPR